MCVGERLLGSVLAGVFLFAAQAGAGGQDTTFRRPRLLPHTFRNPRSRSEQWFLRGRTSAGRTGAELRYRAYQQKLQMRSARDALAQRAVGTAPSVASTAGWIPLGPAPLASDASGTGTQDYNWVSGRATALAIDPADQSGNTVYVGGAYGGVWKSTNAGPLSPSPSSVVWTPLIDNQATLSVGAIAIQPQPLNPDPTKSVILVGTGETNSSTDSYYGEGILRSSDGGTTWAPIIQQDNTGLHSFLGLGFSQIAFSTSNPNLVVAASAGTSQGELDGLQNPVTANLGLYYSTDGGQSWIYATSMDGPSTVEPGSATAVVYNAAAGEFFAWLRFHGLYSSADGVHWARLIHQPGNALISSACPASPTQQSCPIYRGEIAVAPNRAGVNGLGEMYVWYVDANDADQGIWRTIDGGATWAPINDAGITNCGDLIGGCGTENASYNLTLAAVPDNPDPNATSGTDLYAGAVNLYKCVILGTVSDCSGAAPNTFLNLTHVYGCPPDLGSIAKVHPSQHAVEFLIPSNNPSQVIMFFANDGGIYRALDGYTGLLSGACGTPNQFDSLNQTLGSMTQFISLAQAPADPNAILGGAQGNGSPATAAGAINSSWSSVNSGDGGYTQINPSDPEEWFTANTGVSIQRCGFGISCHTQDFNGDLVVSSATLGGDGGPLYTPYILDPQSPSEMIVGTCRVWRGTTSGAGFLALSNNFETGTSAACTGAEINTVRSLAAGGPQDSSGLSRVIYAGTDGTGPLASAPAGGHVWVATNAANGPSAWIDRAGAINPSHFPVSSVAIDGSDPTGNTAYVTIMGFHVSHIWQTRNAGQTWTDFTGTQPGALPDAPANAVLVNNGIVYVGTDVGVFSSSTASPGWSEVGPAPNSGQSGFLPNVSVTALRLFDNGTTRVLRAATYGRGVWQFPLTTTPDFALVVPQPTQTVFAGQTAQFSGTLSALNGFGSQVALSCSGSRPSTCSLNPGTIAPTMPTSPFTVTAGSGVGDYSFSVLGTSNTLSRSAALTLHVVDFSLSAPSPASVTVPLGGTASATGLQVNFLGSFPTSATVMLSCSAPAGITCNFFPGSSVGRSLGSSVSVTLIVAASPATQTGSSTLTVTASSSDAGFKSVTQALGVVVSNSQDYSLSVGAPPAAVPAGQTVTLEGTVTGLNGYSNAVQLSCVPAGGTVPPTCVLSPSAVTASSSAARFSLSASSTAAGSYSFAVRALGSDAASITHSARTTLNFFDFSISSNSASQTIQAGQSATYQLSLTPEGLANFQQAVAYNCSQLPALSSCSFSPSQIASGSGITTVTLTVSTAAPIASLRAPNERNIEAGFYAVLLPMLGMMLTFSRRTHGRRKRGAAGLALGVVLLLAILLPACGGGLTGGGTSNTTPAQPGTPTGIFPFNVVATEGSGAQQLQHSAQLTLTVQ
jgi:large repetitive protein